MNANMFYTPVIFIFAANIAYFLRMFCFLCAIFIRVERAPSTFWLKIGICIQMRMLPVKTLKWNRQCSNWTQYLCCNIHVVLYVVTFCIITSQILS